MPRRHRRAKHREIYGLDHEAELMSGPGLAVRMAPGSSERESVFDSDAERRDAWGEHRDRLIAEASRAAPGRRPAAFWIHDLDRPDLADANPEHEAERIRLLAEGGHLTRVEVLALTATSMEARSRLDTDREQGELLSAEPMRWHPLGLDRLAVAVGEALDEGLAPIGA